MGPWGERLDRASVFEVEPPHFFSCSAGGNMAFSLQGLLAFFSNTRSFTSFTVYSLYHRHHQLTTTLSAQPRSAGKGTMIPIKPTSVASRFVSQSELEAARSSSSSTSSSTAPDGDYDPRSLFERLQANKEVKDAKYDEMFKLSNQFRGIDESESEFLAGVAEERKREEEERRRREREELELFRAQKSGKVKFGEGTEEERVRKKEVEKEEEKADEEEKGQKDEAKLRGSGGGKKKRKANSSLLGVVKKKPSTPGATFSSGEAEKAKPSTIQTTQGSET